MGESPEVVLRDEKHGADRRWLAARKDGQGNLLIEGQDLGPTVAQLLGDREYEWTRTIAVADVPRLVSALGGEPGDEVLEVLRSRAGPGFDIEGVIRAHGIPSTFWTRVGD